MIEFKKPDDFIEEAEKKPVFQYLYSYYDKKLETFNQPLIEKDEPEDMYRGVKAALIKGSIPADKVHDLCFVYLGKVDLKTGKFFILDQPQLLIDCDAFLTKGGELDA